MASASARSAESCSGARPVRASTVHPSARSKSSADEGRSSAITIFNVGVRDEASLRVDVLPSIICGWDHEPRRHKEDRGIPRSSLFPVPLWFVAVTVALRLCKPLNCSGSVGDLAYSTDLFNRVFNRNCE